MEGAGSASFPPSLLRDFLLRSHARCGLAFINRVEGKPIASEAPFGDRDDRSQLDEGLARLINPIHEVTPEFRLAVLWASIDVS